MNCASPLAPLWTIIADSSSKQRIPTWGSPEEIERFHCAVLPASTSLGRPCQAARSLVMHDEGTNTSRGKRVTRRSWAKSVLVGGSLTAVGGCARVGADDRIHLAAWDSGGARRARPVAVSWWCEHLARRVVAPDAEGAQARVPRRTRSGSPNSSTATSRRCAPRCAAIFCACCVSSSTLAPILVRAREPLHRAP